MWNLHALLRRLGIEDNFSDIEGLSSERQALGNGFFRNRLYWRPAAVDSIPRHEPRRTLHGNAGPHSLGSGRPNPELSGGRTGSPGLAGCLNRGLPVLRQQLQRAPHAARALDDMIFGNASNSCTPLTLRVSAALPSDATREADLDDALRPPILPLCCGKSGRDGAPRAA